MPRLKGRSKSCAIARQERARLAEERKLYQQEIQFTENNNVQTVRKQDRDVPVELQENRLRSQNTYGEKVDEFQPQNQYFNMMFGSDNFSAVLQSV